uniref:HIT domain-containing protein n=1 Tax=Hucho hucho TaxID=62062 RepID=A0A4W5LW12_9TELE
MSSIFKKIIDGEIPCYKVAEDENFLAFLDVNPNAKGHTLCIPKQEIDKFFDIEDDLYLGLMQFSKKVAIALEKTVPCKRIGMLNLISFMDIPSKMEKLIHGHMPGVLPELITRGGFLIPLGEPVMLIKRSFLRK